MTFASPWALLALLLAPLLLWPVMRGARGATVRFSDVRALRTSRPQVRALVASCLPFLRLIAFILLVFAAARPQLPGKPGREATQGIDIMLIMDISGTMQTRDFWPYDRLTVAKDTLRRFVLQEENDRLGLVIFARRAFTQCPLTLDHEMVAQLIDQVDYNLIRSRAMEDGTAMGMAIATAAHRLRESRSKSRVMILMTDGMNNAGKIDPITAARAAAALGLRIYTVGVGRTQGGIDEETLMKVAQIGGGRYYRATDPQAMANVYAEIRRLEKSRFESPKRRPVSEEFPRLLWPGLVLLLLAFGLDHTYARRTP